MKRSSKPNFTIVFAKPRTLLSQKAPWICNMKTLGHQRQRRHQKQNISRRCHVLGDAQCSKGLARSARHNELPPVGYRKPLNHIVEGIRLMLSKVFALAKFEILWALETKAPPITNSAEMELDGMVFGNVSTNGGDIEKSDRITGKVNNQTYRRIPSLRPPTWTGSPLAPAAVTGNVTVSAGAVLLPTRYKFKSVSGNLVVDRGLLGLGSHVEIWVTGDVTGTLRIADGVQAKVYVQGSVDVGPGDLRNDSHRASNLQIYGLSNGNDVETMSLSLANGLEAAIYAPDHEVIFVDSGDFSGAVTAGTIWIKYGGRFHYDEALALNLGPILRFDIAGWRETTPGI